VTWRQDHHITLRIERLDPELIAESFAGIENREIKLDRLQPADQVTGCALFDRHTTVGAFELTGARLTGSGTISDTGTFVWARGTIGDLLAGSGQLLLSGLVDLNGPLVNRASHTLDDWTLNLGGTTTPSGRTNTITLLHDAAINNSGTFRAINDNGNDRDQGFDGIGDGSAFNNNFGGTFIKSRRQQRRDAYRRYLQ
jgi:hypothetical protein